MHAEGLGHKPLLTPSGDPRRISQNAHPASTFELSQSRHCKERQPGPRKGFWVTSGSLSPKTAASIYTLPSWPQRFTSGGGGGVLENVLSEAWRPPQFQEKRSRSERAILGALGEFRGILGAALGIGNSILGIRNSILGMASHDLINTKPTILGATLGAIPGVAANPPERFSFAPAFSERFFKNWGGPRARECFKSQEKVKF